MAEDNKKRLGKGLAALLGDMAEETSAVERVRDTLRRIPIANVTANPNNPRQDFNPEHLNELVLSIKQKGVLQPILVRNHPVLPGQYELIAGERRWRASQLAGLNEIPAIIQDVSDQESLELAIIENVQRSDLNPIDEAKGYEQLIEQFSYKQEQLAAIVGKSRSYISNSMRVLKLSEIIQSYLRSGELTLGHAKVLVGIDNADKIVEMVVHEGWSVRDLESYIQKIKTSNDNPKDNIEKINKTKDTNIIKIEERLENGLGLKVNIKNKTDNSGSIVIQYKNLEQFEHFMSKINL